MTKIYIHFCLLLSLGIWVSRQLALTAGRTLGAKDREMAWLTQKAKLAQLQEEEEEEVEEEEE